MTPPTTSTTTTRASAVDGRPADDLHELRLDDRVALVTGAARGIGRATSELLARRGASLLLFDLDDQELQQVAAAVGSQGASVATFVGDVRRSADADAAVSVCVERWGRLDICVNNAGVAGRSAPLWETDDDEWTRVVDIDLNGVFYMCRAATREMLRRQSGRIVNIASIAGKDGNPNAAHYSAAKAAVIGLTKSLGKELAQSGVLVNAIAPAVIGTDILAEVGPEQLDYMRARIPMGRVGLPEEVARLVGFLASDHLSFSTGAVYDLSGGRATY